MPSLTEPCRRSDFAAQLVDVLSARAEAGGCFLFGGDQLEAGPPQLLHPNGSACPDVWVIRRLD